MKARYLQCLIGIASRPMQGINLDHPKLSQDGIYPVGRDSVAGKCRGAEFSERKGGWRRRRGKINMLTRRGPDLCLDGLMAVY